MRDYELTLVISPDLGLEKTKNQISKIKKIAEELKGKVTSADEWGRIKLAYPIAKEQMGYFVLLEVNLPEDKLKEIEKKLKLEEGILRFLLVKKGGENGSQVAK
jgi:small subunit ribosomal protein S6